ncbi:MAG TPA: response regulator [Flavisolibacter sp.]
MQRVISILMVEDDPLDVMDIKRTLDKQSILYKMHVAHNGEEALDILNHTEQHFGRLPDIVLIDINMPRMNGLELLHVIRNNDEWKRLKCFIITSSDENVDRQAARSLNVSGYIIKPFKMNNPSSVDSFNLMIDLMNMKE